MALMGQVALLKNFLSPEVQSAPVPQKSTFGPKVQILRATGTFEWDRGTFGCQMDIWTTVGLSHGHLGQNVPFVPSTPGWAKFQKLAQMSLVGMYVPGPGDTGTLGPEGPFGP